MCVDYPLQRDSFESEKLVKGGQKYVDNIPTHTLNVYRSIVDNDVNMSIKKYKQWLELVFSHLSKSDREQKYTKVYVITKPQVK